MAEFTYKRIDPASVTPTSSANYATQINPNTILRDPRFLNDLRSYYNARDEGEYFKMTN